jgi:serine/threonine protein kinase
MSEIYVGVDPPSDTLRVMKLARDPNERSVRRLFEEEYRTLLKLRHPGVVMVYTCQFVEGVGPCIIEELFDHPTLQEHLAQGSFEPIEVEVILRALLDAVSALHALGIVHRDLKPANVLCERASGAIKVIDLGIARRLDATSHPTTRAGHGTPEVMAPEQRFGGATTPATDVYSLAILVRTLYCGLASLARPHDDFDHPSIPAMVRAVLSVAASERPESRFADARAMAAALEHGLPERPSQPTPARAALLREGVIAAVDKIFARARARVYALQKKVGFTTPQDEFVRELKEIFDETHVALSIVMSRISLTTQDDVSRLTGSRPGLLDPAESSTAQPISSGIVVNTVGGILGAAGLVMGPLAAGAYSVATRKKRMLDACDAALAAFEDTHEAAVQAIIKG